MTFANRVGSSSTAAPGETIAPVYGLNPADSTRRISGNTAAGVPAGSTAYGSSPFLFNDASHTFIATLWALNGTVVGNAAANNLQQVPGANASASFRTSTSGTFAGIWSQPSTPAVIPNAAADTDRPTFQVRVWDTKNGTITDWQSALTAWTAGQIAIGYSGLFQIPYALGGTQVPANPTPNL